MRTCEVIENGKQCENKHRRNGMCDKHYFRVRRYGDASVKIRNDAGHGTIHSSGYRKISVGGTQVYEHRHVMAEALGRDLYDHENVHHINGDRLDNRLENLELWSTSQPPGQRVEDKIAWARDLLVQYGYQVEGV